MTWVRLDCPNWRKMGRPVFAVELDAKRTIVACARVVYWARGMNWHRFKAEMMADSRVGAFTYGVTRERQ